MKDNTETMIVDKLMADIIKGKYKTDDKLPSENDLALEYKVPRIVIRKAYGRIQEMGYIYSMQGKGRYVKNRHQQIELILTGNESFTKKMKDKNFDFVSKNVLCKEIEYDKVIFNELVVDINDKVFMIGRLRIVDGKPIALHVSYVAESVFPNIRNECSQIVSMFEYYNSKGYYDFDSKKSILSISFPNFEERKIFQCPNLIPLLVVESNCIDNESNTVLEYTKIIYRSDYFKYIVK